MAFNADQCKAISQSTGKRCKQPAVKGEEFCRFHLPPPADETDCVPTEAPPGKVQPQGKGAQPGNRNARKHGGYSLQLLPEEEPLYREKLEQFTAQLGDVDIFDAQIVHILSLISTKLDVAAGAGAPADVLIPISNEVLRLLRSLKETRDSRDQEDGQGQRSFADFLEELSALETERNLPDADEEERRHLWDLELEVNDLRGRLDLPPREDIGHRETRCGHCRGDTEQRRNGPGEWICLKCGHVVTQEPRPEKSKQTEDAPAGAKDTD